MRLWTRQSTVTLNAVLEFDVSRETLDSTFLRTQFHEWKLPQGNTPKCSIITDLKSSYLNHEQVPKLAQQISFGFSES